MGIVADFMERRRRGRYHKCLRFGCGKAATYYGRFVGGVCTEHADDFVEDLHPADQRRYLEYRATGTFVPAPHRTHP